MQRSFIENGRWWGDNMGLLKHTSAKTKLAVYEIKKESKRGKYFVNPNCDFYKLTKSIIIRGFDKLPKGFSTDGFGFVSPAGSYLKSALQEGFGENIKLIISKSSVSKFNKQKKELILNHDDYLKILEPLKTIRTERNIKSNEHVRNVLHQLFPRNFKSTKAVKTLYSYEQDKISKIIGEDESILKEISKKDVDSIIRLYSLLEKDSKSEFKYIELHDKNKRKNEKAFLQAVVKEYENRLKKVSLSESDWQRFLRKYILLFNTSYVNAVEKMNVDLRGKYPDFMLVNVYGYIDIYEIKKPSTNLLKHDESRDNYYWDTEVAKAISQTEKYIQMLTKKDKDVRDIIKERHQIDVKIVRPRGYIIVGQSSQFENSKMEDDFRLLAGSLKNVDVILYDELLGSLKNLVKRLK